MGGMRIGYIVLRKTGEEYVGYSDPPNKYDFSERKSYPKHFNNYHEFIAERRAAVEVAKERKTWNLWPIVVLQCKIKGYRGSLRHDDFEASYCDSLVVIKEVYEAQP
ncbi:MAG: hypothetical protein ABIJ57_15780 [Pseudomonadota bacterium]